MPRRTDRPARSRATTRVASAASAAPAVAGQRPAARRGSRRRLWLGLLGASVGWKVLVFTVGVAVPKWLIDDGIGQLPAALQDYGREARRTAIALWDGPIERHGLVRTVRVVSVHGPMYASAAGLVGGGGGAAAGCDGRGAVVRAYTYFGIPYSEVRTTCDRGVVEYRGFRRRKPDGAR